jgi:hypothetical protein
MLARLQALLMPQQNTTGYIGVVSVGHYHSPTAYLMKTLTLNLLDSVDLNPKEAAMLIASRLYK